MFATPYERAHDATCKMSDAVRSALLEMEEKGYAILRDVVPRELCVRAQTELAQGVIDAFAHLQDAKYTPETLYANGHADVVSGEQRVTTNGTSRAYTGHTDMTWALRTCPSLVQCFAEMFGTTDLVSSFDMYNVCPKVPTKVEEARVAKRDRMFTEARAQDAYLPDNLPDMTYTLHIDQDERRPDWSCFQCVVALSDMSSPEDGGTVLMPKTHKYYTDFVNKFGALADTARKSDWIVLSAAQLAWFMDKTGGSEVIKVCTAPGDLCLWDSRLVHSGSGPKPGARARTAAYITYAPRAWLSEADRKLRKTAFLQARATTHWPYTVTLTPEHPTPTRASNPPGNTLLKDPTQFIDRDVDDATLAAPLQSLLRTDLPEDLVKQVCQLVGEPVAPVAPAEHGTVAKPARKSFEDASAAKQARLGKAN